MNEQQPKSPVFELSLPPNLHVANPLIFIRIINHLFQTPVPLPDDVKDKILQQIFNKVEALLDIQPESFLLADKEAVFRRKILGDKSMLPCFIKLPEEITIPKNDLTFTCEMEKYSLQCKFSSHGVKNDPSSAFKKKVGIVRKYKHEEGKWKSEPVERGAIAEQKDESLHGIHEEVDLLGLPDGEKISVSKEIQEELGILHLQAKTISKIFQSVDTKRKKMEEYIETETKYLEELSQKENIMMGKMTLIYKYLGQLGDFKDFIGHMQEVNPKGPPGFIQGFTEETSIIPTQKEEEFQ